MYHNKPTITDRNFEFTRLQYPFVPQNLFFIGPTFLNDKRNSHIGTHYVDATSLTLNPKESSEMKGV